MEWVGWEIPTPLTPQQLLLAFITLRIDLKNTETSWVSWVSELFLVYWVSWMSFQHRIALIWEKKVHNRLNSNIFSCLPLMIFHSVLRKGTLHTSRWTFVHPSSFLLLWFPVSRLTVNEWQGRSAVVRSSSNTCPLPWNTWWEKLRFLCIDVCSRRWKFHGMSLF